MNDTNLVEREMERYNPDNELVDQEESFSYYSEQCVNDEKVVVQEEKRRYKGKGVGKKSRPVQQPIPDPVQEPVPQAQAQEPQHLLNLLGLCTQAEADSAIDPQLPEAARDVQLPSYYPNFSPRFVERKIQDITVVADHLDMEVDSTVEDVPLRCARCFLCHTGTCDGNFYENHPAPGFEMLCSSYPWMVYDQSCQVSDEGRNSPSVWTPLASDECADDWLGRIPGGIQRGPRPRSMEVQLGTPQPSPERELSPMPSPHRSPARSPLGTAQWRSSRSPERNPWETSRRSRHRSPIYTRRPIVALRAHNSSPGALKRPIPSESTVDLSPEPTTSTGHKDVRFPYYTRVLVTPPPCSDDDDD